MDGGQRQRGVGHGEADAAGDGGAAVIEDPDRQGERAGGLLGVGVRADHGEVAAEPVATTWPAAEAPSPQVTVAVKSVAEALALASVKVATVKPLRPMPFRGVRDRCRLQIAQGASATVTVAVAADGGAAASRICTARVSGLVVSSA